MYRIRSRILLVLTFRNSCLQPYFAAAFPYQAVEKRDLLSRQRRDAASLVIAAYSMYAAMTRDARTLHLIVFEQPARNGVYHRLLPVRRMF